MGGQQGLSVRGAERQPLCGAELVVEAIKAEALDQIKHPPSGDLFIPPMWEAALDLIDQEGPFKDFVSSAASDQSAIVEEWTVGGHPISEINGLLRTVFQEYAVRYGPRLPKTFHGWKRVFLNFSRDPEALDHARMLLSSCCIMTNAHERYGPFEAVRAAKGESGGFLDAASSIGIGARGVLLKDAHPFKPVRFETDRGAEDVLAVQGYSNLIAAPLLTGNVLMTDIVPPDSHLARRVSLASNRPAEIMDPNFRRERRELLRAKLTNLAFAQSDLTKRRTMGRVRELSQEWQIRTAFLGTALNQVGQEFVDIVIDNVLWALTEHQSTELVIADFVQRDRRDPSRLFLLPSWQSAPAYGRYAYNYFSVKMADRGHIGWLFGFTGSRPRRGTVGDGTIVTAHGETHGLRELLIARAAGAASVREIVTGPPASNTPA